MRILLIFALLIPVHLYGQITVVQVKQCGTPAGRQTSPRTCQFDNPTVAGNLYLLFGLARGTLGFGGGTLTIDTADPVLPIPNWGIPGTSGRICSPINCSNASYVQNAIGGTTPTVTYSWTGGNGVWAMTIVEISGASTTAPFTFVSTRSTTCTAVTLTSLPVTTIGPGLIMGYAFDGGQAFNAHKGFITYTEEATWTMESQGKYNDGEPISNALEAIYEAAPGTFTPYMTVDVSANCSTSTTIFTMAIAPGGGPPPAVTPMPHVFAVVGN